MTTSIQPLPRRAAGGQAAVPLQFPRTPQLRLRTRSSSAPAAIRAGARFRSATFRRLRQSATCHSASRSAPVPSSGASSTSSDADVDRLTFSGRIQYTNPTDDQAWSPYFAITPRFSYLPTFSDQTEARQDFNFGFNKSWHFDRSFQLIPAAADTSAETVFTVGLTAFAQRRLRQPQLSSNALFLIPSASWAISKDWNASLAVEMLGRWYEADSLGETSRDWEVLPIATVEYILPASLFGSEQLANFLGRPAIDLQGSHLKVWSTVPGVSFNQWEASATLKLGWRF